MRRGRVFFYLAFILILGLVAAVVVWQKLQPSSTPQAAATQAAPAPAVEMVNVVVVTQQVSRGSILTENVLGTIPWKKDALIQGMYQDKGEVVNRQVRFDLPAQTPILPSMLVVEGETLQDEGSLAALRIPRGMVAISIPTNKIASVAYALRSGDHVNLIVTLAFADLDTDFQSKLPNSTSILNTPKTQASADGGATVVQVPVSGEVADKVVGRTEVEPVTGAPLYVFPSEEQRPRIASQTLIQDAMILHMGDFSLENTPSGAQPTPVATPVPVEGEGQPTPVPAAPPVPDVVTLIVSPQDAVTLNYLMAYGEAVRINMALRGTQDDTRVQTEAVTLQFLLDQYRIPVPVKLPYGLDPRVDQPQAPVFATPTPQPQQ